MQDVGERGKIHFPPPLLAELDIEGTKWMLEFGYMHVTQNFQGIFHGLGGMFSVSERIDLQRMYIHLWLRNPVHMTTTWHAIILLPSRPLLLLPYYLKRSMSIFLSSTNMQFKVVIHNYKCLVYVACIDSESILAQRS